MLNLAIFSQTPLAGAPWQQFKCLSNYTNLIVDLIYITDRYSDGRIFPKDLLWNEKKAKKIIQEADIVHIHNYLYPEILKYIDKSKQLVMATLHSVPRRIGWQNLVRLSHKTCAIRQPMQQAEYREFETLPNMFDIYNHIPKNRNEEKLRICYAPSNRNDNNSPLSKGYNKVIKVLNKIQNSYPLVNIDIIERKPYLENLMLKRKCDIVIDDVIHKTFHTTSLEAASHGQIVITGASPANASFINCTIEGLEDTLIRLLKQQRKDILKQGDMNRNWAEKYWNPKIQVKEYLKFYGIN